MGPIPRGCCVIGCGEAARIDVPAFFCGTRAFCVRHRHRIGYTFVGQSDAEAAQAARERRLERTPGQSASCAFPKGRTQQADRQLQTHTDRKVTVRVANAYQSAPAAYRLTLVGAAVMSAGGRQPLFDSIPSLDRSQCTDRPAASTEVGRHGHGRQGDLPFPVQCEAVKIRVMGRTEYKTAQPELGT